MFFINNICLIKYYINLKVAHTYVEMLQKLRREGYNMDKLFLVGHGVGAHICGAIGREFSSEKHLRLNRITGLDPVGEDEIVVL